MKHRVDFCNAEIECFEPPVMERPMLSVKYPLDPVFMRFLETLGANLHTTVPISIIMQQFRQRLLDAGYGEHATDLICNATIKSVSRGACDASANN